MARANRWLAAAAVVVALGAGAAGDAGAQKDRLRVAIYAPWSGPSTVDERDTFAIEIEGAIEAAGLGPVKVSSFAKLKDFKRALSAGDVDVAVVDSGATASLGKRLAVVASWSSGRSWVMAGSEKRANLRNARLALQADARSSARLVETLLRGEASPSFWASIVSAPVTEDARQLVLRGMADVVVVPVRLVGDLPVLADLGVFSELAVATADAAQHAGAVDAVKSAVQARLGGSWSAGKPKLPKPASVAQLAAAPLPEQEGGFSELLSPAAATSVPLDVAALWIEPDAP